MNKISAALVALFAVASIQGASAGAMVDTDTGRDCFEAVTLKENMSANGMKLAETRATTGTWDQVTLYKSKNGQNWALVGKLPSDQEKSVEKIREDNKGGIVCEISAGEKNSYKQDPDYQNAFKPKP